MIAKCMADEVPLVLSKVTVGSGTVAEGTDLSTVHALLNYVADGAIANRSHDDDLLSVVAQYSNADNPSIPAFYLAEFMIYAEDPDTEEDVDFLYATLGDYKQPVPAYVSGVPGSVFNLPLTLAISDDLTVEISASPGIVTYDQLQAAVETEVASALAGKVDLDENSSVPFALGCDSGGFYTITPDE